MLLEPTLAGQCQKITNLFAFFRKMHVFYCKIVSLITEKICSVFLNIHLTRFVARKIETKIETVLEKK